MKKIAVFASGSGSNFQAILDARLDAEISLLVCDKPQAFCVERAKKAEVPTFVFQAKEYASKEAYELEILHALKEHGVELIVLAGYMRLIGPTLLQAFEEKIVNIHPSLLPAFPGKDAIGQALEAKVKVSGVTVHYVDAGMDTGPIIAQRAIELSEDETKESLQTKIHRIEHELYPKVIQGLLQ
ncbi:phosphoribosylglycinamide formyltransferase [Bacillaceae bacterium CLA-AA-H227]|uniref:Phosphoribosylglycinamide formyltransferase n=1 Tax=Robertmurraya yapensis (ex Hitch et al 2024) TaxID=3133160 RepID=A0ACC6SFE9_9BACI